jgi:hypothetical protein
MSDNAEILNFIVTSLQTNPNVLSVQIVENNLAELPRIPIISTIRMGMLKDHHCGAIHLQTYRPCWSIWQIVNLSRLQAWLTTHSYDTHRNSGRYSRKFAGLRGRIETRGATKGGPDDPGRNKIVNERHSDTGGRTFRAARAARLPAAAGGRCVFPGRSAGGNAGRHPCSPRPFVAAARFRFPLPGFPAVRRSVSVPHLVASPAG